jgi:serine protease Do
MRTHGSNRWCTMRPITVTMVLFAVLSATAQTVDVAKQVYDSSQDSVFLVYLNDATGTPSALGSAFLVAPRVLVTNFHVVKSGSPVLAVGPVRVPLKVVRIDQKNDLAILSVDVELTSRPLALASGEASPGEQVFAIGNPEGLEKTISQGIVSGIRKAGDRDLLQITSPISHGSSGGPILNKKGEVVGVVVGMLEDGQNLNFAIPVDYVKAILNEKANKTSVFDLEGSLSQVSIAIKNREQAVYSDDPSSEYQKDTQQLLDLANAIVSATGDEVALTEISCLGTNATELSDVGIKAARKLVQERPSTNNRALLSYVLYDRAESEDMETVFAKKGSDEETRATEAHKLFLTEASREASEVSRTAKGDTLLIADFVLGSAKNDQGEFSDAVALHAPVANGGAQLCGVDLAGRSLEDLILESVSANRPDDAETWFRRYASLHSPTPYEWDSEGDRRNTAQDGAAAADAYERAAAGNDYFSYDYCFAASQHYFQAPTDSDGVLTDGRKCADASINNTQKANQHYFDAQLPYVYSDMAEVLEARGAYQPALEYIKNSLATKPDNPFALQTEAKIFADLERYSECIAAAQAAIRASDGKYPSMQFQLGYCQFATENWSQAATSFRIAAEGDSSDAVSAFNLGLCLARQGFDTDANHWFREALNRKPDEELRVKILNLLK